MGAPWRSPRGAQNRNFSAAYSISQPSPTVNHSLENTVQDGVDWRCIGSWWSYKTCVGRTTGSRNADFEATRASLLERVGRRLLAPDGAVVSCAASRSGSNADRVRPLDTVALVEALVAGL